MSDIDARLTSFRLAILGHSMLDEQGGWKVRWFSLRSLLALFVGDVLFDGSVHVVSNCVPIGWGHVDKLDPIPDLKFPRDDNSLCMHCVPNLKANLQHCTDGKRKQHF